MSARKPRIVVGLDLSLTCTGIAVIHRGQVARTQSVKSKGKADATYTERIARLAELTNRTVEAIPPGSLIVVEGPSYGSSEQSRSFWDRAGHWHLIAAALTRRGCLIAVASPNTVKKWATGSGTADKVAVALAMARLFPEVELANSDEADALACAQLGAHRLGWHTYSATRSKNLEKVAWPPEIEAIEVAA